jgi:hypothetical protein
MLNAHLAMMPRLSADESLLQVRVARLGSGTVEASAYRTALGQFERAANGAKSVTAAKPTMPEMTPEVRALMGLEPEAVVQ